MRVRRRLFRFLFSFLLVGFLGTTAAAAYIYQYGQADHTAAADVIIILGGGTLSDGSPSPATTRRVEHAVALYQKGLASFLICTGGYTQQHPKSEGRACADLAHQKGVPSSAILTEEVSTSTEENAIEARKVMAAHGFKTALLVTDNFHMLRAEMLFHRQGVSVILSPAQVTAGPLEGWRAVVDTYREVGAFGWYGIKTALGLPNTSTRF
jgi:uncharacterized SAM-binding protein YcdF (DUF218 family)